MDWCHLRLPPVRGWILDTHTRSRSNVCLLVLPLRCVPHTRYCSCLAARLKEKGVFLLPSLVPLSETPAVSRGGICFEVCPPPSLCAPSPRRRQRRFFAFFSRGTKTQKGEKRDDAFFACLREGGKGEGRQTTFGLNFLLRRWRKEKKSSVAQKLPREKNALSSLFYLPRVEKGGKGPLMTGGKSLEGRRENIFASAPLPCEKTMCEYGKSPFARALLPACCFLLRFASTRGGRMSVAKDEILPPPPPFHFSLSLDHPRYAPPHITLFPTRSPAPMFSSGSPPLSSSLSHFSASAATLVFTPLKFRRKGSRKGGRRRRKG